MTGACTLRVARPEDAAAVSAVLASAYPALLAPHYEPAVLAAVLPAMIVANARLLASGTYFVQAAADGLVVACGGWTRAEPGTGKLAEGVGHVRHFGTHPDWVRRGLGRGIFARCRDEARAAGIGRLMCFSSLGAEAFYASLGFDVEGRGELAMPGGLKFPMVTMVWTAPAA